MIKNTRGKVVLVTVLLIAGAMFTYGVHVVRDEHRMSSVVSGMKPANVQEILGPPTDTFQAPLPPIYAPRRCIGPEHVEVAALYARPWRDSLLVFFGSDRRVVCTERVSIAYSVHVLH